MFHAAALPGFLATAGGPVQAPVVTEGVDRSRCGVVDLWRWGVETAPHDPLAFAVSKVVRRASGAVSPEEVAALLRSDPRALTRLLPPFGGAAGDDSGAWMVADSMGFQHLFHSHADGSAPGVLSSSGLAT